MEKKVEKAIEEGKKRRDEIEEALKAGDGTLRRGWDSRRPDEGEGSALQVLLR